MKTITEIKNTLQQLGRKILAFDDILEDLSEIKKERVNSNDANGAKEIWALEQIVLIHRDYNSVFNLLKEKKHYDAWQKLETIEITFSFLKRHVSYGKGTYGLYTIERCVKNLQSIYPYRIFSSIEILEKEKKCTICNQVVSIRKPCGHIVGEIYNGEMCGRIITNFDLLGIALVENPVNKYAVGFMSDPETNETKDQYNYAAIDILMDILKNPYEPWDLEIQNKLLPHSKFSHLGHDDYCPCGSGKKYIDCCLNNDGVRYQHYEFLVKKPIKKTIMINTRK